MCIPEERSVYSIGEYVSLANRAPKRIKHIADQLSQKHSDTQTS